MSGRAFWLTAAITILSACQSQDVDLTRLDDADLAALTALDDVTLRALETRDWEPYRPLVTDNVRWMWPGRETLVGWNDIEEAASALLPLNNMTTSNRRFAGSGDMAYRTVDYVMHFPVAGSTDENLQAGKLLTIYRRGADGQWLIETEMWNANPRP
jgi:ketosteroid isomerase-like protein